MDPYPPPSGDPHWIYDDPSGVPEPEPKRSEPLPGVPVSVPRPIAVPLPAIPKAA